WTDLEAGPATFAAYQLKMTSAGLCISQKHYLKIKIGASGKPSRPDQEKLSRFVFELDFPALCGRAQVAPSLKWKPNPREKEQMESVLGPMNTPSA
ncbi:MAG: hypothetical protein L0170_17690, partial [Acidobacteria bacterium]|nr:hypothetical protein [Acidobacteriota bacterium]